MAVFPCAMLESDKPLLDYRVATFSDFLYGFMKAQNLTKATFVGNSLGGWIALEFATTHAEMVDKLVLVDSAGLPWQTSGPAINLNPATLAATRTMLEALFYNKKIVSDDFVQQVFVDRAGNNDGYTIERTTSGFSAENQFEDKKLASIHAPTLVVWGHDDELISSASGQKLHEGIAGSKLVVFDQCGHLPEIEKAADFNKAVLDFLGN